MRKSNPLISLQKCHLPWRRNSKNSHVRLSLWCLERRGWHLELFLQLTHGERVWSMGWEEVEVLAGCLGGRVFIATFLNKFFHLWSWIKFYFMFIVNLVLKTHPFGNTEPKSCFESSQTFASQGCCSPTWSKQSRRGTAVSDIWFVVNIQRNTNL